MLRAWEEDGDRYVYTTKIQPSVLVPLPMVGEIPPIGIKLHTGAPI